MAALPCLPPHPCSLGLAWEEGHCVPIPGFGSRLLKAAGFHDPGSVLCAPSRDRWAWVSVDLGASCNGGDLDQHLVLVLGATLLRH